VTAIKHLKKALAEEPNDPELLWVMSHQLSVYIGKPDIAEPYVKRLMDIDPLTPTYYTSPTFFYWMKGEPDRSIVTLRKWLKLDPEGRFAKYFFSRVLSMNEQTEEAFELIDQIVKVDSQDFVGAMSLALKYALQGDKAGALQVLTDDVIDICWNDPEGRWWLVENYSLLDEKEEGLKWLDHAINQGFINYPFLAKNDPFLENIRGEPRFKKLMERVKHEWESFEV
jgi:tetratricopeptide (TPR) repeat protein